MLAAQITKRLKNVNEKLKSLLTSAIIRAKGIVPELQCDWINLESTQTEDKQENSELHISLTRPIYLRHYQREDLKRSIKAAAQSHSPLVLAYFSRLRARQLTIKLGSQRLSPRSLHLTTMSGQGLSSESR